MISKISSVKLLKESVKRSMAFLVLLELLYFCYFAVGSLLYLQITPYYDRKNLTGDLLIYGAMNPLLIMSACVMAGILGIMQFSYLHNREKTDFYHSLPVRRERLFGIQYAAGVLIWLLVYCVNAAVFLLICLVRGLCSLMLAKAVLGSILVQLVCFLLIYSLAIFAVMLTGKLFAAVVGFGIICVYTPAVGALLNWMMGTYFSTYSPQYGVMDSPLVYLTPIYAIAKTGGFVSDIYLSGYPNELPQIRLQTDYLLGTLLAAALIAAFCIWLYRRRASEAAGKTMAFLPAARVIKFLLVVPMALAVQLLFYSVTYENAVWGFFGLLFGLLVFSAAIEFVYTMDIREIFRDRWQLLITAVVSIAIVVEFQFDLTGYDKWLPVKTEVKEAEVELSGYLSNMSRGIYTKGRTADNSYYVWERYAPEEMYRMTDMDALYEILEQSAEFAGEGTAYYDFSDAYQIPLQVIWRLENGTTKIRRYTFTQEKLSACFQEIWDSDAYQEARHPILKEETEELLKIEVYGYEEYVKSNSVELTEAERAEFLEVFCRELRNLTINQALAGTDIHSNLELFYSSENGTVYGESFELSKGAFPETRKLLKEYGFLNDTVE